MINQLDRESSVLIPPLLGKIEGAFLMQVHVFGVDDVDGLIVFFLGDGMVRHKVEQVFKCSFGLFYRALAN